MPSYEIEDFLLEEKKVMSDLFSINWKDILNGFLFAVLGDVVMYLLAIFGGLYELVLDGKPFQIHINIQAIIVVAVFSGLTYLSKRFLSGTTGNLLQK